jgi:hypothetical protein
MNQSSSPSGTSSNKAVWFSGLCVLGLILLGWILWLGYNKPTPTPTPAAQTAIALHSGGTSQSNINLPPEVFTVQPGQPIPDEVIKKIQDAAQAQIGERMKKYASMTPEEKRKHLDEQIDRQQKMQEALPPSTQPGTGVKVDGTPTSRNIRIGTRMDPKSAMENLPPELRAQLAQYQADMNKRRAERGLPPSQGGVMLFTESRTLTMPGSTPSK